MWGLFSNTFASWSSDKAARIGAALAFYSMFSIAPLLILSVTMVAFLFGEQAAAGHVAQQLEDIMGPTAAEAVQELVKHSRSKDEGLWATLIGLITLYFGATGVFVELQDALNTIFRVPPPAAGTGIWDWIKDRLVSFLVILSVGVFLLASVIVSSVLATLNKLLATHVMPLDVRFWQTVHLSVAFVLNTLVIALLFRFLPNVRMPWRAVGIGSAVTAVLFMVGQYLLSWYLARGTVASTYGAAGTLVVVLVWIYYSAQIFLLGAEFTRAFAEWRYPDLKPHPEAPPA